MWLHVGAPGGGAPSDYDGRQVRRDVLPHGVLDKREQDSMRCFLFLIATHLFFTSNELSGLTYFPEIRYIVHDRSSY